LRGHDLVGLFDDLPAMAIEDLKSGIAAAALQSPWKCGISDVGKFRKSLEAMRNAFAEWRYLHEKDPTGAIEFRAPIFAMEISHSICQGRPQISARV
jgi:hypothetical protein